MTDTEVEAYLDEQRTLNIATVSPSGHPHLVAMWYARLEGDIVFWTFGKSQKVLNIRRDPRITALIESGDVYNELRGVELIGTARLIEDHDKIVEIGTAVAVRYNGLSAASGAGLEFIRKQAHKRIGVAMTVDKVVSWDHTKLGGAY